MNHVLASGAGAMVVTSLQWFWELNNPFLNVAFPYHQSVIGYSTVSNWHYYVFQNEHRTSLPIPIYFIVPLV